MNYHPPASSGGSPQEAETRKQLTVALAETYYLAFLNNGGTRRKSLGQSSS